jgi:uncharacterized protein
LRKWWAAACAAFCVSFAAAGAQAAPAMWVARDADSEIYLFGTLHLLRPDAAWRTAAYERAYAQAHTVWFEADLSGADRRRIQDLLERYGVDPARPLSAKLAPRQLSDLQPLLARSGAALPAIDHMRPWAAALMLSVQPLTARGAQVEHGADAEVQRQTQAGAKRMRAFETLEDQVRMFAGLSEPVELKYLADVIAERRGGVRLTLPRWGGSLEDAWLDGDLARLGERMAGELREGSPEFYEAFLRRRNLAWAEALDHALAEGAGVELVNVGALHMVGAEGLPALLAARGYEVRRVQ